MQRTTSSHDQPESMWVNLGIHDTVLYSADPPNAMCWMTWSGTNKCNGHALRSACCSVRSVSTNHSSESSKSGSSPNSRQKLRWSMRKWSRQCFARIARFSVKFDRKDAHYRPNESKEGCGFRSTQRNQKEIQYPVCVFDVHMVIARLMITHLSNSQRPTCTTGTLELEYSRRGVSKMILGCQIFFLNAWFKLAETWIYGLTFFFNTIWVHLVRFIKLFLQRFDWLLKFKNVLQANLSLELSEYFEEARLI